MGRSRCPREDEQELCGAFLRTTEDADDDPYLNFQGQTEEAFSFYATTFGTELTMLMCYSDMPAGGPATTSVGAAIARDHVGPAPGRGCQSRGAASATCGVLPTAAGRDAPRGFPAAAGRVLPGWAAWGGTTVVNGLTRERPPICRRPATRFASLLKRGGYTIDGQDQEQGKGPAADFSGPVSGSISVHPRCQGY